MRVYFDEYECYGHDGQLFKRDHEGQFDYNYISRFMDYERGDIGISGRETWSREVL